MKGNIGYLAIGFTSGLFIYIIGTFEYFLGNSPIIGYYQAGLIMMLLGMLLHMVSYVFDNNEDAKCTLDESGDKK